MKKVYFGGVLIFWGLFLLLGFVQTAGKDSFVRESLSFLIIIALPIGIGSLLIRSHLIEKRKIHQKTLTEDRRAIYTQWEREIIRLARYKKGVLSINEIVAGTSITTATDAEIVIKKMIVKGYLGIEITESGNIIFKNFRKNPKEQENLQKEYELYLDKLIQLKKALAIESDPATIFKLENQIKKAEEERNKIAKKLE